LIYGQGNSPPPPYTDAVCGRYTLPTAGITEHFGLRVNRYLPNLFVSRFNAVPTEQGLSIRQSAEGRLSRQEPGGRRGDPKITAMATTILRHRFSARSGSALGHPKSRPDGTSLSNRL